MLSSNELQDFKDRLEKRFYELREIIRLELINTEQQSYIELAGKIHDIEEQSVADLLVDLNLADIDRHVDEIRDIDAALMRIAQRSYGICSDCGQDVDKKRLLAEPTASRCHACQQRHEQNYIQAPHASL
jgi:RNA polymerase-binding transcription factor DksA